MATVRNPRARRTLVVWGVLLAFVFALTVTANIAMARYAREAREQRPETYLEMAEVLLNQGTFERALETWQEAYTRAPNSPYVQRVLGDIHYTAQHWEESLRAYERAMALGSRDRGIYVNMLWSLVQLGRYREALNFANLCIDDGIAGPELYRRTSEACFRGGMMKESIPSMRNLCGIITMIFI